MLWRITSFLLCQLGGGLLGYWLGGDRGAEAGIIAGGIGWFVVDALRGVRVVRWLRRSDISPPPVMGGLWGEIADRTRRAFRARELEALEARQRLQEFLAAIQASPNGVVLLDPEGRIEWSNETALHHLGIDPQRDLMQHVGNLLREPAFTAHLAGQRQGEVSIAGRSASASRPVRVSVQLHPYGEGRKLLLSRDVTQLEQAETMRRDFVANVSHEIRTPLTVLTGFVETLQTLDLPPEERGRYLQMMAQQAQRMQGLVSDLLTLSRLEGSPLPNLAEWTPLGVLLAQCEHDARSLDQHLGKRLDLRFASPPALELAGAQTELLSALGNLVSNAIRYTPAQGRVEVGWQALPGGGLEFSVRDTGPGIAPEHVPRLTERFYRVDRSRSRETGGTGLGLAIVKHVLQRHGAELRIDSAPGAGSTFAISFPPNRLRPAQRHADEASAQPATAVP